MQRRFAPKSLVALLAAAVLALPFSALPASAAQAPTHLDDEVNRRLQTTPESGLILVIVECAAAPSPTTNPDRAQQAQTRVLSNGGPVVGSSSLLGASIAE